MDTEEPEEVEPSAKDLLYHVRSRYDPEAKRVFVGKQGKFAARAIRARNKAERKAGIEEALDRGAAAAERFDKERQEVLKRQRESK